MVRFVVGCACETDIDLADEVSKILKNKVGDIEKSPEQYEIVKYLITHFQSSSESVIDELQKNLCEKEKEICTLKKEYIKSHKSSYENYKREVKVFAKCCKEVYPDIQGLKTSGEEGLSETTSDDIG